VSAPKHPVPQAADSLPYAPIGLVMEARHLVPTLAERGRQQLQMFRMIGRFAVHQGQAEAARRVDRYTDQVTTLMGEMGLTELAASFRGAEPDASPAPAATAPAAPAVEAAAPVRRAETPTLAISDYDSLAASQVIPRLAGLGSDELEAVRRYEASNRGRKTILGKIAQLQDA
jgi:hypothetical protein